MRGATSRPLLAEALSLYSSTLSIRLKEMFSLGLVQELESDPPAPGGTTNPGRKARIIDLDPVFGLFGGLYLRQDGAGLALFGPNLVLQRHWEVIYQKESGEPLKDALRDLIHLAGEEGFFSGRGEHHVRGIGIAVSSVVSSMGRVYPSSHYPWKGDNLLSLLQELSGVKELAIDNDANMAALADAYLLRKDEASLIHLLLLESVPTIGCGLYLNGELYRGSSGAAGELDEDLWPLLGADSPKTASEAKISEPWPDSLAEEFVRQAARLSRFLVPFIDPDKICISGVIGDDGLKKVKDELRDLGGRLSIEVITDPFWVEKGGAVKVFQQSIETLVGGRR